ncbi:MAG: hypothetical protein JXA64_02325 [Candidatus Fermentibacteraceae bacterium]|nr:hypothetical protein [Candidatus Fermentibacteraceae bacterium]
MPTSTPQQHFDWHRTLTVNIGPAMQQPRVRGLRIGGIQVFQGLGVDLGGEIRQRFSLHML